MPKEEILGVVQSIEEGEHGGLFAWVTAIVEEAKGEFREEWVTFSLNRRVWTDEDYVVVGARVVLSSLSKKSKWRANRVRNMMLSEETKFSDQLAFIETNNLLRREKMASGKN